MTTSWPKITAGKRFARAAITRCGGLGFLVFSFLLVVVFVNPVREMMFGDDWAYGLTVRHLFTTDQYKLHDWGTANMPVQIYWAAFLAHVFGYSFTVLRCSTLILFLIGLIAFYYLLRDFGVGEIEATLLTLVVLSAPPVLMLSFTFHTDVQFLAWNMLAFWFYTRALRDRNYGLMALASLAAFAAIGTRQFGVALVAGLVGIFLFREQQRLRRAPLYIVGLLLPLLMTAWQFHFGVSRPTFFKTVQLTQQLAYVTHLRSFATEFLLRPAIILQYLALLLLPLVPILVIALIRIVRPTRFGAYAAEKRSRFSWEIWTLAGAGSYVTAALCYGYLFYVPGSFMPYLAWLLPNTQWFPFGSRGRLALTVVTCGFAIVLLWLLLQRYLSKSNWRALPTGEWFLVLCGCALCGIHLVYNTFSDVYLIQFLPFAAFALGRMMPTWSRASQITTAVLTLAALSSSALWARGHFEYNEASWRAAESLRSSGVPPREIGGNMTWSSYNGAFDEWISQIGGLEVAPKYANRVEEFFEFLKERYHRAQYLLTPTTSGQENVNRRLLTKVAYRDRWLRRQYVYVAILSR